MYCLRILRILFQILAFAIFTYQMKNSVLKYIEKPILQQSSRSTIDEIQLPLLYVCESSQFNYSRSQDYGYDSYTDFIIGHLR